MTEPFRIGGPPLSLFLRNVETRFLAECSPCTSLAGAAFAWQVSATDHLRMSERRDQGDSPYNVPQQSGEEESKEVFSPGQGRAYDQEEGRT